MYKGRKTEVPKKYNTEKIKKRMTLHTTLAMYNCIQPQSRCSINIRDLNTSRHIP